MSALVTICRAPRPYVRAEATNVRATWEAHGFRPTTMDERLARQKKERNAPANRAR